MPLVTKATLLRPEWLPNAPVRGIVSHWTGGGYIASSLDKEHYHFVIEGDGDVLPGLHSLVAVKPPLVEGEYAAHTKRCNSYYAGVSCCSMNNATESPLDYGRAPLLELQWQRLVQVNAELCYRYKIAVSDKSVLTHGEVQTNLGIQQNGKWDIKVLKFAPQYNTVREVGDKLRSEVMTLLR